VSGSGPLVLGQAAAAIPSRSVVVLDAIKHAILTGQLRPGQNLVETDLAQALGVSKTPVREALKTLAGAGLVTMSPYRGATVRTVDDEWARSVYDMRLLLEPEAVRRAAASGQDWTAARSALTRSDSASDRAERSLANRDFHRALYAPCGNPILVTVLDDLRDQTALLSASAWTRTPSWRQEADEHRAILAAAESGDPTGAATLLHEHISTFVARNFGDGAAPEREPRSTA